MRFPLLSRLLLAFIAVGLLPLRTALADEMPMMPPMDSRPDLLAPLSGMIGEWEGSGTSTYGPFYCHWEAKRQGNWIVSIAQIYTAKGGEQVAANSQVFGADENGGIIAYNFDETGMNVLRGSADEHGGSLSGGSDNGSQAYSWTVNADGTITSHFEMHMSTPMPPFPADFVVDEVDTRVTDGGN